MTEWKNLTKDEQVAALQQVAGQKHIPPQAAVRTGRTEGDGRAGR